MISRPPNYLIVFEVTCGALLDGRKHLLDSRSLQLLKRLGLNLSDPLSGDGKILPNLFKCRRLVISDAETEPDDCLFSRCQGAENSIKLIRHFSPMDMGIRRYCLQIRQQLAQFSRSVSNRMFQSDRLLKRLNRFMKPLRPHSEYLRDLF